MLDKKSLPNARQGKFTAYSKGVTERATQNPLFVTTPV